MTTADNEIELAAKKSGVRIAREVRGENRQRGDRWDVLRSYDGAPPKRLRYSVGATPKRRSNARRNVSPLE